MCEKCADLEKRLQQQADVSKRLWESLDRLLYTLRHSDKICNFELVMLNTVRETDKVLAETKETLGR